MRGRATDVGGGVGTPGTPGQLPEEVGGKANDVGGCRYPSRRTSRGDTNNSNGPRELLKLAEENGQQAGLEPLVGSVACGGRVE